SVAPSLQIDSIVDAPVGNDVQLEGAVMSFAGKQNSGLIVMSDPSRWSAGTKSLRWHLATNCRPLIHSPSFVVTAGYSVMASMWLMYFGVRQTTKIEFSRALAQRTSLSSGRPNTSWSSISRLQRRSASRFRQPFLLALTR